MERKVSDEYLKKIDAIHRAHIKKYGYRKMSNQEFNTLFGK